MTEQLIIGDFHVSAEMAKKLDERFEKARRGVVLQAPMKEWTELEIFRKRGVQASLEGVCADDEERKQLLVYLCCHGVALCDINLSLKLINLNMTIRIGIARGEQDYTQGSLMQRVAV